MRTGGKLKAPFIWTMIGFTLSGASVVPIVSALNTAVYLPSTDITYYIGIADYGRFGENVNGQYVITDRIKEMKLDNANGLFVKADYPWNFFKFYQYVKKCTLTHEKNIYTKDAAKQIFPELNRNMILTTIGTVAITISGGIFLISLIALLIRFKYRHSTTREEYSKFVKRGNNSHYYNEWESEVGILLSNRGNR